MNGLVLDAGAFIGLERRKRHVVALLERAKSRAVPMVTSAAVVAQVWRGRESQASIALAFRWRSLNVAGLTYGDGRLVGQLLGATGVSDVVDAHVVILARARGWPVVTSDPDDLHRLDPTLVVHTV